MVDRGRQDRILRRRYAGFSPARRCGRRRVVCRQGHERRAIPGVRQRTVSHGRQTASRFLRSASAFGDRRGRPWGKPLAGQPGGWPSFKTNKPSACAAPLSRRTGPETASATTGLMPNKPPSSGTPATADGTRRQEQKRSRSPRERHEPQRRDRQGGDGRRHGAADRETEAAREEV